jgi:hypothetical protein
MKIMGAVKMVVDRRLAIREKIAMKIAMASKPKAFSSVVFWLSGCIA